MSKWIPITEREPEEGTKVLVTARNGAVHTIEYVGGFRKSNIIAWQSLPKPYEVKENKDYHMTVDEASWRLKEMFLNCECECQGDECDLCSKAVYKAIQDMEQVKTIKYELE